MRKYEVYENNAGGLTMFVWDAKGENVTYAHSGYEYTQGTLKQDIVAIQAGESPDDWDGNGSYTGLSFDTWEDMGLDLADVYRETVEYNELVADNDGVYADKMGRSAEIELLRA